MTSPIVFTSGFLKNQHDGNHRLRTPREETAFTARPKINSQSQIFRYGQSIFCLPHRPNFSDFFDLCLHWVSVVRWSSQHRHCNVGNEKFTSLCESNPSLILIWMQSETNITTIFSRGRSVTTIYYTKYCSSTVFHIS